MHKIEQLEKELGGSVSGREVYRLLCKHFEEVITLVNKSRPVMVAWQRNQGPAFISSIVESGFEPGTKFKKEVNGVSLQRLLIRMADVLQEHGSYELSQAIGKYSVMVLNCANECDSLQDVFHKIRNNHAVNCENN